MKILIFNTFYYPNQLGGAEKSVQLIAEGLKSIGEEPVIVCTSDRDHIDNINGVQVYYINTNNIYWSYHSKEKSKYLKPFWHLIDSNNIFIKSKIEEIIKTTNPDVVHTNNLAGLSDIVWVIAKKYNKKIVHTIRDYYQLCPKSSMFNQEKNCDTQCSSCKIFSIPKKKNSELVDSVIGVSDFILQKHLKFGYFKNANIKTHIYNPAPKLDNIKKSKSKNIRLGLVGIISKTKGSEFILKQFSKLHSNNLELHIFGKGETKEYEHYLKQKFISNKNIYFNGFKKVDEIYTNIDILIISSLWHEPFPRTLIETMSYKTLVLATNRGGTSEMVIDGENGYIFDPDIDGDFEKKLDLVIQMYRKNHFEFDLNQFHFNEIINRYLDVYNEVL